MVTLWKAMTWKFKLYGTVLDGEQLFLLVSMIIMLVNSESKIINHQCSSTVWYW